MVLTINGQRLNPLSVDDLQYFETRFFLVPGTGTVYVDAKLSVIRQRAVGGGFHEELTILNHDDKAVDLAVRIEAGNDFADLFEVKDALKKKGEYYRGRRRPSDARLQARDLPPRDLDLRDGAVPHRRARPELRRPRRTARRMDDRPPRDHGAGVRGSHASPSTDATPKANAEHGAQSRPVAGRGASLRATGTRSAHLPERSLVDLAALRFSPPVAARPQPARRRPALVHDDVRARQHLHQPAGAALHSRAGGEHAASPRHLAGHAASTTSATRTRAASCTRCATAR